MPHAIVWFDMPVEDLDRAIRFYSAVLGHPVTKEGHAEGSMGILHHERDDVSGCLVKMPGNAPSANGPLMYFNAEGRLDAAIEAATANGGKVLEPKHGIGPYGHRAVVLDSEGNRIALHSMKE